MSRRNALWWLVLFGLVLVGIFYLSRTAPESRPALARIAPTDMPLTLPTPSDLADSNESVRKTVEVPELLEESAGAEIDVDSVPPVQGQSLCFRVLHPDGRPAVQAPVAILMTIEGSSGPHHYIFSEHLRTNDHGRIELLGHIRPSRVTAFPPRWTTGEQASEPIEVEPKDGESVDLGDIYLRSFFGPSVVGRFVDREGRGVPGVEAVLRRPRSAWGVRSTFSDHEGRFEFVSVRVGEFQVNHNKEAAEDGATGEFLLEASRPVAVTVSDDSAAVIDLGEITLHIDFRVYLVHVHPPPDVLPSTVSAQVTSSVLSKGYVIPISVDDHGIASWNPSNDNGLTQTVRVKFERRSGPDHFESTFTVEPGKIERILIP